MSDIAIRVEGLSKRYRIGEAKDRYYTLRDSLAQLVKSPLRRSARGERRAEQGVASALPPPPGPVPKVASPMPDPRFIWALKDVSFEVKHGEVIGIIGRNGAGKTTLLKILSRITEPTEGHAEIRGRAGSLLEVGTGFHQELTGRENIYLSGAILGMKKAEIDKKFDEIIAFSEIEKFLDTPAKRYSSGMYVRLAFAVAAHLEPEILLVDEVLAVGDAAFQKKCLGKMGEVAKEGRAVLFVSHNMGALLNICPRAILLVEGKKEEDGPSGEVVRKYIGLGQERRGEVIWDDPATAPGSDTVRLRAVRIVSGEQVTSDVEIDKDVRVEIEFWNFKPGAHISASIHLLDKMGVYVLASANMHSANLMRDEWFGEPHPAGLYRTSCTVPGNFLNEETYSINAIVLTDVTTIEVFAREIVSFRVHETGGMRKEFGGEWLGVVRPKLAWQTEYIKPMNQITNKEKA